MNRLKRTITTVCLFALVAVLVACQSTALPTTRPSLPSSASAGAPSPTPQASEASQPAAASATPSPTALPETPAPTPDETEEPEPEPTYDIPDIQKVGLTNVQYENLDWLIFCTLNMNKYFSDPKSLETEDLMAFVYPMLDKEAGESGSDSKYHYSKEAIENIINSAFNVGFVSKGGINYKDVIIYKDGQYTCDAWDDTQSKIDAYPYKITWIAPHILRICFNMIDWNLYSSVNCGKCQIVLVENKASKFGFTIQSLTVTKIKKPVFTNAQASSFLSSTTKKAYIPTNILDKKSKTAWATDKGVGQWIKITSKSTQTVTGMDIQVGDRSGDDDRVYYSGQPSNIKLEFSDGTTIERELELPENLNSHFCISFGREIKTTYIKITILTVSDVATTKEVYISEIIPF